MAVNKVVINTENGEETIIDLTSDNVTPETLAEGATAHDASGKEITGTMPTTAVLYTAQELTDEQKAQARANIGAVGDDTAYTNVLLTAIDTDGSIYNGKGWKENTRISSGGTADSTGVDTSGFIKVDCGDVVRFKNIKTLDSNSTGRVCIGFWYDLTSMYGTANLTANSLDNSYSPVFDDDGNLIQITIRSDVDITYFRMTAENIDDTSIITINEEIPEDEIEERVSAIETAVAELDTRLTTVENSGVSEGNSIPDYWQTHLDERVEDIRRAMEEAGRNKSAFFFYSDAHWDNNATSTAKMSPTLLKYLYKKTPINKTNYGGDIVFGEGSTDTDDMTYLWDWREQLRGLPNHHSVIGNHDDGNGTMNMMLPKEYIYSYLIAPEETPDMVVGDDFYYYVDVQCEKTRYIYIDMFYGGVTEAQLAFVKEALQTAKEGWHIVSIAHAWFANDYSVYPPVLDGFASEVQTLLDMFDSYNTRSGDFTDSVGKVELCIGGHYHLDHYDHTPSGIPVIIVEADTLHDRSGTMPQKGTTDEAAVSAVVVDYNDSVVKVIRVGRGESYEVPIDTVEPVGYTNVIPLSVDKEGNPFNGGKGWTDNSRIGSGGIYTNQTGDAAQWCTGYIEIDPTIENTFYLKNVTFNTSTGNGNHGIAFFDSSFTRITNGSKNWVYVGDISSTGGYNPVRDESGNVVQFTLSPSTNMTNTAVKYIAICCGGLSDDSIITIDEPID